MNYDEKTAWEITRLLVWDRSFLHHIRLYLNEEESIREYGSFPGEGRFKARERAVDLLTGRAEQRPVDSPEEKSDA